MENGRKLMIFFENDYLEGAHEKILTRLVETNKIQASGYGTDDFSQEAAEKIKEVLHCPEASIHFLMGGTQTNQVVISSMLKRFEGVISADTGHISTHEAGAIEFSGHKVLTVPATDGKISAEAIDRLLATFYKDETYPHMVFPGMVYLSYPTEYGTLYTLEELEKISSVCHQYELPLYIDGARLGYGLACAESEVSIEDIARVCDVFYIGGTKIGALCGEAVVFTKNNEPAQFTTLMKQNGALLAKGRLIGIQFLELFSDHLYFELSKHAIDMAMKVKRGFIDKGYQLFIDSPTNQQFFIMSNEKIEELRPYVQFSNWEVYDETYQVIRVVTSWATLEENVELLLSLL